MNKLKQQLRLKMLGQLSDENTEVDVNNAYGVCKDFTLSFLTFLRENYHTEFETWTRTPLKYNNYQDRDTYNIESVENILNKFIESYEQ